MLILSRHADESIVIGDDIVVTVTEIRGGTVRIGIDAPPELRILREELLDVQDDLPIPVENEGAIA